MDLVHHLHGDLENYGGRRTESALIRRRAENGTNFAASSWRPECGAIDPCQRRKPPEAVAKVQRLQGSIAR